MKNNQPLNQAPSLSISEAAQYMRSSRGYIYELIRRCEVDWFYRGQRRRILRRSLDEYEKRQAARYSLHLGGLQASSTIDQERRDREPRGHG